MPKITLRFLNPDDPNDKTEFFRAFHEDWKGWDFIFYWDSLACGSYEKFVSLQEGFTRGEGLPEGHIASTFLFAFNEEGRIVGRTSIRHELNEFLFKVGGHVGYGVCPSFRRQGYAYEILKETKEYIRANLPHLKKLLVTCDDDNIGSLKTIEKHGGVLENKIQDEEGGLKRRYWISLLKNPEDFLVTKSEISKAHDQEELKLKWKHAAFSDYFGLKKVAAHTFIIPPGYRSSEPHAEKLEEEFVFVISGEIDLWLNGKIKTMKAGDCIGFPAGTGIGHCFINNSKKDCEIFVSGDRTKKGNQYHFHMDPSLKAECGDAWWDDMPAQSLGGHDGLPGPFDENLYDQGLATLNGYESLKEASFSYPGDSETFGDGLCLSRHFGMKNVAIWLERLMPGKRASWPHAHKTEEEFIYILEGEGILWLDGVESKVNKEMAIDFKAGSRVAHTIINKSNEPLFYLCVGECEPQGDQIFYPLHPKRNEEMRSAGALWEF